MLEFNTIKKNTHNNTWEDFPIPDTEIQWIGNNPTSSWLLKWIYKYFFFCEIVSKFLIFFFITYLQYKLHLLGIDMWLDPKMEKCQIWVFPWSTILLYCIF